MTAARYYVGGGNIAGILGLSPYRSPLDEYRVIMGEGDELTPDQVSFFRRRKSFEPVACEILEEKAKVKVVRTNQRYQDTMDPTFRAEIDVETDDEANGEVKTVHPLAARDWGRTDEGDGEDVPTYVLAQGQWGMGVKHAELCRVLAMVGFDDPRIYVIRRDEETINWMRAQAAAFWRKHILTREPPGPRNLRDVLYLHPTDAGRIVEAEPIIAAAVRRAKAAKLQVKELLAEIDQAEEQTKLFMADAATLTVEGVTVATWKGHDMRIIDQGRLRREKPEVAEAFERVQKVRTFRTK